MAESNQGRVAQAWNRGDPPPGYYYLNLQCEHCGARNGYIFPEAGAPPLGSNYVAQGGTQIGVCQRCGKSDRCVVMSEPKRPPPTGPEPWSW